MTKMNRHGDAESLSFYLFAFYLFGSRWFGNRRVCESWR